MKIISKVLINIFKTELLLSIIFFIIPIVLPLTSEGDLLESVSAYAYARNGSLYNLLLILAGYLIIVDGITDMKRRYNIILGIFLICVALFPVLEWRWTHDTFAFLFFIGNTYIVTYYSKLLSNTVKHIFKVIILVGIMLFLFDYVTLFVTEAIGFFSISFFMFIRFMDKWEPIK